MLAINHTSYWYTRLNIEYTQIQSFKECVKFTEKGSYQLSLRSVCEGASVPMANFVHHLYSWQAKATLWSSRYYNYRDITQNEFLFMIDVGNLHH